MLWETFGGSVVCSTLATNVHANYRLKPTRFINCLARFYGPEIILFFHIICQFRCSHYLKSDASALFDRKPSSKKTSITFEN